MNEQSIDEIITQEAFKQMEKLKTDLTDSNKLLVDNITSVNELSKAIGKTKSFSGLNKSAEAAALAVERLAKAEAQAAKARAMAEKAEAALEETRRRNAFAEEKRSSARQAAADREAAAVRKVEEAEKKKNRTIVSNSQEEIDAAKRSAEGNKAITSTLNDQDRAYAKVTNDITAETVALKQNSQAQTQNTQSRKQQNFLLAEEKFNLQKRTAELKNEVREANAVKGSLEQRRAALIRLNAAYDNQSPQERASASGQRLQKIIEGLNSQVLTLEKNTGRSQRNVGNYGSALGGIWGGIRQIANVLPGVGIAGVIAFATEPIIEYLSKIEIFKKSVKEAATVTAASSTEYKNALTNIISLRAAVSDYNAGLITGNQLLNQYNSTLGNLTGQLKSASEVEEFYNSKAEAFVKAMSLRARATAALQVAVDKTSEAEERAADTKFIDKVQAAGVTLTGLLTFRGNTYKNLAKEFRESVNFFRDRDVKSLRQEAKTATDSFLQLQKEADAFAKKSGLNFNNKPQTGAVDTSSVDGRRAAVEAVRDYNKEIVEDDIKSYEDRFAAAERFTEALQQLAGLDYEERVLKAKGNNDRILAAQKQFETDFQKAQIDGRKERQKIQDDIDKAVAETRKQVLKEFEEEEKRKIDILELSVKEQIEIANQYNDFLLTGVASLYAKGEINEKQYAKARLAIQRQYVLDVINEEIKGIEEIIGYREAAGLDTADDEKKLAELRRKLSRETAQQEIDDLEKIAAKQKELNEKKKELAYEVAEFGISLVDATFENEKNKIQDQIDQADKKRERDIENVNLSVLSEEEKADKIAVIEAQANARKTLLEQQQRQVQERQARFDRAVTIAKIIADTASAIVEALPNIPLSVLIGAIGAAQIATVLATPIPRYEKGTDYSKEGLALTDEKGPEGYITPDGRAFIGNDRPTLRYLQAGTKVIPHHELARRVGAPTINRSIQGREIDPALLQEQREANKLLRKISRKKEASTIPPSLWHGAQKNSSELNDYLKTRLGK